MLPSDLMASGDRCAGALNRFKEDALHAKIRTALVWLAILLTSMAIIWRYQFSRPNSTELDYSEFLDEVSNNNVRSVVIKGKEIHGVLLKAPIPNFVTYAPEHEGLIELLRQHKVTFSAEERNDRVWLTNTLYSLPSILILLVMIFLFTRQLQGGGKSAIAFGKSRAKLLTSDGRAKVTLADVAGVDEAKEEFSEIIDFLRDPTRFTKLGGKIPKGVLLVGPPGTGKTLLARAIAGEADVPFFSISGSDFVEMFVGVGASRVRDLFEQGKKNAPCLIFVDEIDAVGRHRGAGLGGGHDEREQTLNQLLVEMDGFESNEGVILIAATNRPDILDPALLRPGRFDRQIVVDTPDVRGREAILKVHIKRIPLSADVDLPLLARGTPGFSGADLANMVNEAALLAARADKNRVDMIDFEKAKDKVLMGAERRSLILNDEEKRVTAYHESGHALVAFYSPLADPIHKVSIIPRGRSLGTTQLLPIDDRHTYNREYLLDLISQTLGGRAAEALVFNTLTTGASNDIKRATDVARKMVCEWGMSETLGPVAFSNKEDQIFIGKELGYTRSHSEQTAQEIDAEIHGILQSSYTRARQILESRINELHSIAATLLEREVLDYEDLNVLLGKRQPQLKN